MSDAFLMIKVMCSQEKDRIKLTFLSYCTKDTYYQYDLALLGLTLIIWLQQRLSSQSFFLLFPTILFECKWRVMHYISEGVYMSYLEFFYMTYFSVLSIYLYIQLFMHSSINSWIFISQVELKLNTTLLCYSKYPSIGLLSSFIWFMYLNDLPHHLLHSNIT